MDRQPKPERVAVCPTCGYSLQGLKGTVCPECGKVVTIPRARFGLLQAEWAFLGGVGWALAAVVACVIAIVATANDPLWPIALWVPGAMLVVAMAQVSIWALVFRCLGHRHRRAWAIVHAVVSWGLGMAYFLLLFLTLIAGSGK